MRFPYFAVKHVGYAEDRSGLDSECGADGEDGGGLHIHGQDALFPVSDDLLRRLPVRRIGGPARTDQSARDGRAEGGEQLGVGEGPPAREGVVMRRSLISQRGRAHHRLTDLKVWRKPPGRADSNDGFHAERRQLFDHDGGDGCTHREKGETQSGGKLQHGARRARDLPVGISVRTRSSKTLCQPSTTAEGGVSTRRPRPAR